MQMLRLKQFSNVDRPVYLFFAYLQNFSPKSFNLQVSSSKIFCIKTEIMT